MKNTKVSTTASSSFLEGVEGGKLIVAALENGTVIDRIPSDKVFKVISILHLDAVDTLMTIGINLKSFKLGKKGIIKIKDKYFENDEISRIALIAPLAKLNIIKNYEVVEKCNISLPAEINDIVLCNNPMCITNNEPVSTRFHVINSDKVTLKCHYCERMVEQQDIKRK